MSLQSLLEISSQSMNKDDISEERLDRCLDELREKIAFYRAYPDIFVDDISGYNRWLEDPRPESEKGKWKGFKFYYYQRIMIRASMRHRKTYFVFSRGFSKSFLSMLVLLLKAVLYPNSELFITTGGRIIII